MPGRPPLSVVIITLNEEHNIVRCVRSCAAWAAEVLVVDAGSSDRTRQLAAAGGATVLSHAWEGYGQQKNWALNQVRQPWVLFLDADEELTAELRDEISAFVLAGGAVAGTTYRGASFPRKTWFLGRWIRHGGWYPNRLVRLAYREGARWTEPAVHEALEVAGPVRELRADLLHYTFRDVGENVQTNIRFSRLGAKVARARGERGSTTRILLKPIGKFLETYFWKLGILDGFPGFVISLNAAHSIFLKYVELRFGGAEQANSGGAEQANSGGAEQASSGGAEQASRGTKTKAAVKKILIIDNTFDPPHGCPEIQALVKKAAEGLGDVEVTAVRAPEAAIPERLGSFDGVILSGSKTRAADDAPWIEKEMAAIRELRRLQIPTFGICYGEQLIARTFGAPAGPARQYEYGWVEIQAGDSPLFEGLPKNFYSFEYHQDEVRSLPAGFRQTASSAACPVQAYDVEGAPMWGVQFHPERGLEQGKRSIANALRDQRNVSNADKGEQLFNPKVGETIFRNFLKKVWAKN